MGKIVATAWGYCGAYERESEGDMGKLAPVEIYTVYNPAPFKHSKGVYTLEHVRRLDRMIDEFVTVPCRLNVIESEWPGWWGKIELFKYDRVFYMDLSVAIIANIDDLLLDIGEFCACRDFVRPEGLNSKVMSWAGDYSHVYEKFAEKPDVFMAVYAGNMDMWGDQSFIDHNVGDRRYFQDVFPNSVVSYKMGKVDSRTKIIGFHGRPKPEDTEWW